MESCRHLSLVLVRAEVKRRCQRCQLVLSAEELGDSFCPECYEEKGQRNYAFENVKDTREGKALYLCEDCGVGIAAGVPPGA